MNCTTKLSIFTTFCIYPSKGTWTTLDSFLFSLFKNDSWNTKCCLSESYSCVIRAKPASNGQVPEKKNHSDAANFYQNLTGSQNSSQQTQILHNTYALGARSSQELAEDEFVALADVLGYIPDSKNVLAFTRLKKGKEIFHSSAYKKVTVRNSYTVLYRLGESHVNFGQIMYFFQYKPSCPGTGSCMFTVPVMLLIM